MRHYVLGFCAAIAIMAGCSGSQSPLGAPGSARAACGGSRIGQAQCDVLIENTGAHSTYSGWDAKDLEAAYNLPVAKGEGQNVFVVDVGDNPNVASDFATYRKDMGLPAGTLKKYYPGGKKCKYPPDGSGWPVEIDLDVEMASAGCPKCTIDLVEACTNQWSDIEAAEAKEVKLGETIISNSYDGSGADESYYDTKGVTYLASAGDSDYGVYDPATFKTVISVGGTELTTAPNKRGYDEVVWPFTGGGCSSTNEPKPKWQHDPDCKYRTANDVAAVAVNAAEYDSYEEGGWITVDGTSISSPLVAGMVALAGNSTKQDGGEMLWTLTRAEQKKYLYPVTSGSDASGDTYLTECGTQQFGISCGPAGWGTPHGVGAF